MSATPILHPDAEYVKALGLVRIPLWKLVRGEDGRLVCACPQGAKCESPGKHPIGKWRALDSAAAEEHLQNMAGRIPYVNYGVRCDDLLVVDVDPRNGGDVPWAELLKQHGAPETLVVETGGGGLHYYFRLPKGAQIKGHLAEGIDLKRGPGNYVVGPGSWHESGKQYRIADWGRKPVADPPAWLVEAAMRGASPAAPQPELEEVDELQEALSIPSADDISQARPRGLARVQLDPIPQGKRHDTLLRFLVRERKYGASARALSIMAQLLNRSLCSPQKPDQELRRIVGWVMDNIEPDQRAQDDEDQGHKTYSPDEALQALQEFAAWGWLRFLSVSAGSCDESFDYLVSAKVNGEEVLLRIPHTDAVSGPRKLWLALRAAVARACGRVPGMEYNDKALTQLSRIFSCLQADIVQEVDKEEPIVAILRQPGLYMPAREADPYQNFVTIKRDGVPCIGFTVTALRRALRDSGMPNMSNRNLAARLEALKARRVNRTRVGDQVVRTLWVIEGEENISRVMPMGQFDALVRAEAVSIQEKDGKVTVGGNEPEEGVVLIRSPEHEERIRKCSDGPDLDEIEEMALEDAEAVGEAAFTEEADDIRYPWDD